MSGVRRVSGLCVALDRDDVDTDQILPADHMKGLSRHGLGAHLFARLRLDSAGLPDPAFMLNRHCAEPPAILLVGGNFGCGSSREHAVWALIDQGIGCLIGTSFGTIFANNCRKNGLVAARVTAGDRSALREAVGKDGCRLAVNLERCEIEMDGAPFCRFAISKIDRKMLLAGGDEIDRTLEHLPAIEQYERGAL